MIITLKEKVVKRHQDELKYKDALYKRSDWFLFGFIPVYSTLKFKCFEREIPVIPEA